MSNLPPGVTDNDLPGEREQVEYPPYEPHPPPFTRVEIANMVRKEFSYTQRLDLIRILMTAWYDDFMPNEDDDLEPYGEWVNVALGIVERALNAIEDHIRHR